MIYLAYGSNLNLEQMALRCPDARVIGSSVLRGYRLVFRGRHGGAVATIEPQEGGCVPALLWKITPSDEAALDRYEGWPFLYHKETAIVELGGKLIQAMAYIMNPGRPLETPGKYYYATILEGYKAAGFDVNILRTAVRLKAQE